MYNLCLQFEEKLYIFGIRRDYMVCMVTTHLRQPLFIRGDDIVRSANIIE